MIKFLILTILLISEVFACKVDAPKNLSLFTDLTTQKTFYYQNNNVLEINPAISIGQCQQTAGSRKFIMIGLGVEELGAENLKRSISFNGSYGKESCRVDNIPANELITYEEKYKNFLDKNFYFKKCLEVVVQDSGMKGVQLPTNQKGCIYRSVNKNTAIIEGGFCYFKPNFDSQFTINIQIKKQCQDMAGLDQILQGPKEVNGAFNIYLAGDASGSSPDLDALSSTAFKVSTDPLPEFTEVSDNYGHLAPAWSSTWVFPDVKLGEMRFSPYTNDFYRLNIPLFVDNRCDRKCIGKVCSSACDYSSPVVGEFTFEERTGEKWSYLTSWFDGGISPARWQGLLNGMGIDFPVSELKEGNTYRIVFEMKDPKIDFEIFKKNFNKLIPDFSAVIGRINRSNSIQEIGQIPVIPAGNVIPNSADVPMTMGAVFDGIMRGVKELESMLNYGNWPAYYNTICSRDFKKCMKNTDTIFHSELVFRVKSKADRQEPVLEIISHRSRNFKSPKFENQNTALPKINCD